MRPPRIKRTTITATITGTTVTRHGEEPLGPINVAAWGAGLFGAIVGLVIAACFVVATSPAEGPAPRSRVRS